MGNEEEIRLRVMQCDVLDTIGVLWYNGYRRIIIDNWDVDAMECSIIALKLKGEITNA